MLKSGTTIKKQYVRGGALSMRWGGVRILTGANAPAPSHDSFRATYIVDRQVTIKGTVAQFLFRHPHSFVHVVAPLAAD
jgi:hypothetical protein